MLGYGLAVVDVDRPGNGWHHPVNEDQPLNQGLGQVMWNNLSGHLACKW